MTVEGKCLLEQVAIGRLQIYLHRVTHLAARFLNILRNYRGAYDIGPHREFDFKSLRDYPPFQELVRPKG